MQAAGSMDGGVGDPVEWTGADGVRFWVDPDWAQGGRGEALHRVLLEGGGEGEVVLKENPVRRVVRVGTRWGGLVVKRYRVTGAMEAVKERVGLGRARREWETARAMAAAGIPVARAVALVPAFSRGGERVALFAAEEVAGAVPLGGFLEARFQPGDGRGGERQPWLLAAARLLAAVHGAGFDHRDFHGGNVLVEDGVAAGGRLVVIDLHRVHRVERVPVRRRVRALADLAHTLRLAIDDADAAVLVRAYLGQAGLGPDERWVRAVTRAVRAREARRIASRSRRCVREGSEFTRVRLGGTSGFRRRAVAVDALFTAVEDARAALREGGSAVRSLARRSSVAVVPLNGGGVAVKVYEKDGTRRVRGRVSVGRAGRAWRAAHGLWVRGVGVPRGVAWLRTPDRSYLVVDEVSAAVPLSVLSFQLRDPATAAVVADAVGRLVAAMVAAGVEVNDLSPKNVLLSRASGTWQAWLCDFDGVRLRRRARAARVLRALAQLNDVDPRLPVRLRLRVLRQAAAVLPALRRPGTARAIARLTARRADRTLAPPWPGTLRAREPA